MRVIHHIDDDGLCAAAIVGNYLLDRIVEEDDFFPYNHGGELKLPEEKNLLKGETWYIVDLALDDVIFNAIEYLTTAGCRVVHIDHHQSGIDYYNSLDDTKRKIMDSDHVTMFYNTAVSGTMLTWIYSCLDFSERKNPGIYDVEFAEDYSRFIIKNAVTPKDPMYIPFVVRYVDDYDVWRFALSNTMDFHNGFMSEDDKRPFADIWKGLFTSERFNINPILARGKEITKFRERQYKSSQSECFESEISGIKCLVCNEHLGDSHIFGEKINEYPMCVRFYYSGKDRKWKYSFYSSENGINVAEVAERFGGGGHAHAAGCVLTNNLFAE